MFGHRTYIDNEKLISTEVRKAPVPKGHRTWLEPKSDRTEKVAA